MIIAIVVVLPAPLPPSRPVMLPRAIRNDTSSPARGALSGFFRCATSTAAGACGPAAADCAGVASLLTISGTFIGPSDLVAQGFGESIVASSFETARSRLLRMRSQTLMVRSRESGVSNHAGPRAGPNDRANL